MIGSKLHVYKSNEKCGCLATTRKARQVQSTCNTQKQFKDLHDVLNKEKGQVMMSMSGLVMAIFNLDLKVKVLVSLMSPLSPLLTVSSLSA